MYTNFVLLFQIPGFSVPCQEVREVDKAEPSKKRPKMTK